MVLQTIRPNIVQAIRAWRPGDLMLEAQELGQHFLYVNLTDAQNKQDVLDRMADAFMFAPHFGKNLDALSDCLTDLVHKAGPQPGFVVVIEQIPDHTRLDRESRELLLDVFRDAADFWAERRVAFRCFYSLAVARAGENPWDHVESQPDAKPPTKSAASKAGVNPSFGMNMPMMSSAFDTSMWLTAA